MCASISLPSYPFASLSLSSALLNRLCLSLSLSSYLFALLSLSSAILAPLSHRILSLPLFLPTYLFALFLSHLSRLLRPNSSMASPITSLVPVNTRGGGEKKALKWEAWLSKSSLGSPIAHQYALLFSENELDEEDAAHFDHDFLLSMGISIAKHRLEILKLARKEWRRRHPPPPPATARLLAAASNARRRLARCLHSFGHSVATAVPRSAFSSGRTWASTVAPSPIPVAGGGIWASVATKWGCRKKEAGQRGTKMITDGREKRWDSMFQDLRPT